MEKEGFQRSVSWWVGQTFSSFHTFVTDLIRKESFFGTYTPRLVGRLVR